MFQMLRDRVAIVTGAARGIGLEITRLLLAHGARVALVDIHSGPLGQTAALLGEAAADFPVDVADAGAVSQLVQDVVDRFGCVEILINNAAINPITPWDEICPEEWERVFAVNVRGPYLLMRAVAPAMQRQGWGRIINIASIAGKQGGPNSGIHYCASKAALMDMTRYLARQVGRDGITVNSVAPGIVDTDMTASWPLVVKAAWNERNPIPRLAQPLDIARAVLFLASDLAEYITGETLDVNGGALMD
ncbi:MAG: SDR family oxidoreductase [Bradyrhizobiaceae bacterium]|nr:SDR family oxidoreductase [Bradyrhizobiaceae bacterium]